MTAQAFRPGRVIFKWHTLACEIVCLGQFDLDRMDPIAGAAIMAGCPPPSEPPVANKCVIPPVPARVHGGFRNALVARSSEIGSKIDVREHPIEQERDPGSDRVTVHQDGETMLPTHPLQFPGQRGMIGMVPGCKTGFDICAPGRSSQIAFPSKSVIGTRSVVFAPS